MAALALATAVLGAVEGQQGVLGPHHALAESQAKLLEVRAEIAAAEAKLAELRTSISMAAVPRLDEPPRPHEPPRDEPLNDDNPIRAAFQQTLDKFHVYPALAGAFSPH